MAKMTLTEEQIEGLQQTVCMLRDAFQQWAIVLRKTLLPAIRTLAIWLCRCNLAHQLTHRWHLLPGLACPGRWVAWHLPDILILKLPEDWVELRVFSNVLSLTNLPGW